MMERWNAGILGLYWMTLINITNSWDKPIMDLKNINRGFKKLRVWQDVIALFVLACKIFTSFPFELKKIASNSSYAFLTIIPLFRYSIIPCRRHKTSMGKNTMLSICYRNSKTLQYDAVFLFYEEKIRCAVIFSNLQGFWFHARHLNPFRLKPRRRFERKALNLDIAF